jgi:hypothetical protein
MTTTKHTITVRRTYTIEVEGTIDDFVQLMDSESTLYLGHQLDSLDAGDAIGAVLELADRDLQDRDTAPDGNNILLQDEDPACPVTVKVAVEDALFEWSPELP